MQVDKTTSRCNYDMQKFILALHTFPAMVTLLRQWVGGHNNGDRDGHGFQNGIDIPQFFPAFQTQGALPTTWFLIFFLGNTPCDDRLGCQMVSTSLSLDWQFIGKTCNSDDVNF